jgi:hypothetical protein
MKTYRITFAKNEIISCKEEMGDVPSNEIYNYVQERGNLIYAIVKTKNEENALTIANMIIKEVKEKIYGNDFVS